MGAHETPTAELDRHEADWLRAYAAVLTAELPVIMANSGEGIWAWAGKVTVILEELARG